MTKKKSIPLILFILIHLILYLFIYAFKIITGKNETIADYIVVISCFLFSLVYFIIKRNSNTLIFVIAFLFTILADTNLLILDDNYELGILTFIIVQFAYFWYILKNMYTKDNYSYLIAIRLITIVIGVIASLIVQTDKLLVCLVIIYISNLVINLIISIIPRKRNLLFSLGLFLFLLCDICVGCYNIGDIIDISNTSLFYKIANLPFNIAWLFYHPSQVLLAISNYIKEYGLDRKLYGF